MQNIVSSLLCLTSWSYSRGEPSFGRKSIKTKSIAKKRNCLMERETATGTFSFPDMRP
jgi:hypothetical protein